MFNKIILSLSVIFLANLMACGDDSSSNATDSSDSKDSTITSSDSEETNSSESNSEEYNTEESSESNEDSGKSSSSNTPSADSGEKSSGSAPVAMISCDNLPEEGQKAFGTMGEKCTEFEKGSMYMYN